MQISSFVALFDTVSKIKWKETFICMRTWTTSAWQCHPVDTSISRQFGWKLALISVIFTDKCGIVAVCSSSCVYFLVFFTIKEQILDKNWNSCKHELCGPQKKKQGFNFQINGLITAKNCFHRSFEFTNGDIVTLTSPSDFNGQPQFE